MNIKVYSPLAKEYNLHKSPLEHIYGEYAELHMHKILLTCNYRTHKDILKVPSKLFYKGKLKSCKTIEKHPTHGPLVLLKSDSQETYSAEFYSYYDVNEADEIICFLKEKLLPEWPVELWGKLEENAIKNIAILTTEYAQVSELCTYSRNMLLQVIIICLGAIYPILLEQRKDAKDVC